MSRIGAAVTAVSMAAVAGSAGALLLRLGMEPPGATATALALLFAMLLFEQRTARRREKAGVEARLRRLEDVVEHVRQPEIPSDAAEEARRAAMAARLSELEMLLRKLGDRLAEAEARDPTAAAEAPPEPAPAPTPMEAGTPSREAEPAPAHPANLAAVAADYPEAARPALRAVTQARVEEPAPAARATMPTEPASAAEAPRIEPMLRATRETLRRAALLMALRGAIEERRLDAYLRPIVALPSRRPRFYEVLARLRSESGEAVPRAEFTAVAEPAGLMPAIDHMQVTRSLEIAGRLEARRQDAGLFCGLSVATLGDGEFFPDFLALLEANRKFAPRLVFGLAQAEVKAMGPIEIEALRTLAELGFRFSLAEVGDLRIDAQELAGHGFRFVKAPVETILGDAAEATDIHPADFAALLARFGLTLIVDGVARESAVPELLDYGVRCAEGALFGAARLVRAEASLIALPQAAE